MGRRHRLLKEWAKKTSVMDDNPCLNCGATLTRSSSISHESDVFPGAVAICSECGHIQAFDKNLKFRELTDEEVVGVAGNKDIIEIQKKMAELRDEESAREEIAPMVEATLKNLHLTMAHIINAPFPGLNWCATDKNVKSLVGYGETPEEAAKNMFKNYIERLFDEALKRRRGRRSSDVVT
jgi:transcription elongation factor Elf1